MNLCLFVIDLQNGFITQNTSHVIQRIKSLLQQKIFEYVIFTRFLNTFDSPYVRYLNWNKFFSDTERKLVDEIEPFANVVFNKTIYTACNEETLRFLKKRDIHTVFICGIDTEACVLKTAIYSASNGGDNFHQAAILVLSQLIGRSNIISEPIDKFDISKYL